MRPQALTRRFHPRLLLQGGAVLLAVGATWVPNNSEPLQSPPAMLAGACLLGLVAAAMPRVAGRRLPRAGLWLLLFLGWASVSTMTSMAPYYSQRMLAVWLAGGAVALAIVLGSDGVRTLRRVTHLMVGGATLLALSGLAQVYLHRGGTQADRLTGTFTNADCFGALMLMALALALGLLGGSRARGAGLLLLEALMLGTALILTLSRAAAMGAAVAVAMVAVACRRRLQGHSRQLRAPAVAGVLAVGCLFFLVGGSDLVARFAELKGGDSIQGISVRLEVLRGAPATVARSPWLGFGPANFQLAFQRDRPPGEFPGFVNQAHIDAIQVAVETGLPGLLLLAAAWIGAMRGALRAVRRGHLAAIGPAAGLAGVAVYGLTNFAVPVSGDLIWICALLGLGMAWDVVDEPAPAAPRPALALALASLLLVAAGAWSGTVGWLTLQGEQARRDADQARAEYHWTAALQALGRAIALEPGNERSYQARSLILEQVGQFTGSSRLVIAAREDLQQALALNPNAKGLRLQAAQMEERRGDWKAAQNLLHEAIQAYPEDPGPWCEMGRIDINLGRPREAAEALWRAFQNDSDQLGSLSQIVAALEIVDSSGAPLLSQWSRESPATRPGLIQIARQAAILAVTQNPAAASRFYQLVLSWDAHDASALMGLAAIELRRGEMEPARQHLEQAVQEGGDSGTQAFNSLVDLDVAAHRWDPATQRLTRYLEANPSDVAARLKLADVYRQMKRLDLAIEVCQEGAQRSPSDARLRAGLGELYFAQGSREEAARSYQEALDLDPDNGAYQTRIQEVLHR